MMSLDTLLEHLDAGQPLVTGTEAFDCMHGYSYEAMRLTAELNNAFHKRSGRSWGGSRDAR